MSTPSPDNPLAPPTAGAPSDIEPAAEPAALFEFIDLSAPPPPADTMPTGSSRSLSVAKGVDPWAHRRGEPRLFAFFWTFYVMLAVGGSVTWLARAGVVTPGTYGPAARIMLIAIAVGMVVLWPMTRLSQVSPRGNSIVPTLADLLVVQFPIQIVVWPLYVMANWPGEIVKVVAMLMGAWGVLAGGVLALALGGRAVTLARDPRLGGRVVWMMLFIALVLAGPIVGWVIETLGGGDGTAPPWLWMASPVTAISALTGRGLIGPTAPATELQWRAIIITLSAGVFAWALAAARNGVCRGADEPESEVGGMTQAVAPERG